MTEKSMLSSDLLPLLRSAPLFAGLSESVLAELAQHSHCKKVSKGAYFFFQTDPAEAAYVVQSGGVSIVLSSPDGRELVINEMHPGDCFGELGLLTGQPRSTGAVARGNCEVVVIPRRAFLAAVDAEPHLARRLLETTAQRLSLSSERESALAFLDAQTRLAKVLLELDQQEEENGYVTISQEELAQRTSLTRQTVASILGRWRRAGWLLTGRGRIIVLDRPKLQKLQPSSEE